MQDSVFLQLVCITDLSKRYSNKPCKGVQGSLLPPSRKDPNCNQTATPEYVNPTPQGIARSTDAKSGKAAAW